MKIRSITYFFNPGWPLDEQALKAAEAFIDAARPAIAAVGYEVQTARLATLPFPRLVQPLDAGELRGLAQALEVAGQASGFDYLSLGPALPNQPESYALIPEALAATQNVFFTGLMTEPGGGVNLPAVRACAEVMVQAATLSPDGFGNLRFAALANVPPGAPFFPAAYHGDLKSSRGGQGGGPGQRPAFALATEAAGLAVEAFERSASLAEARQRLIELLEGHAAVLNVAAESLAERFDIAFGGIDFTPAPFPEIADSLGTALERLGVPAAGRHGSLAAAAFLADTLDRASFPQAGFCGLMLPVLEDATLAARAAEGVLSVKDLLMYSAVCGTGLDTVPLPGDSTAEQLSALLLDLAALAQRLDKPLTARLMPIPGKRAGEPTGFDFAYFANSRVLALEAEPLQGLLAGKETFTLQPRASQTPQKYT